MRDHAKLRPQFWIRGTGKALRGDREAREMAIYLMSAPTSNMLGLYYLPLATLAHELDYPDDDAVLAPLTRLIERGFCAYDRESEYVWVINGAREQIEEQLKRGDKRIKGIRTELRKHAKCPFHDDFVAHYRDAFCLGPDNEPSPGARANGSGGDDLEGASKGHRRGSEAQSDTAVSPSKPGAGAGAGTRAGAGADEGAGAPDEQSDRLTVRSDAPSVEREDGEPEPPDWRNARELVRKRFHAAYREARGDDPTWPKPNLVAAGTVAAWLEQRDGDPERILAATLTNFFADEYAKACAFPIELLAKSPGKFWKPPEPMRTRHRGFAPASKRFRNKSDAEMDAELDSIFGPAPASGGVR